MYCYNILSQVKTSLYVYEFKFNNNHFLIC